VRFRPLSLDDLHIEDERSYRHVALYDTLKQALRRDGYRFRVPVSGGAGGSPRPTVASWDRVLFLNLTFWDPGEQGDVLAGEAIPADVVTHVAWHHLARRALERASAGRSAEALFLAEAIASAFDLYLVGRLLGHAPGADLLETQVPAMSEVTEAAGLSQADFEALLEGVAADPDRAFEDLRALLFDAAVALSACTGVDAAAEALDALDKRRFGSLLHHYELSNWILYARAHGTSAPDPAVRAVDATLRAAPIALEWLEQAWVSSDTGTIGSSG
jgi:hypothetical protein